VLTGDRCAVAGQVAVFDKDALADDLGVWRHLEQRQLYPCRVVEPGPRPDEQAVLVAPLPGVAPLGLELGVRRRWKYMLARKSCCPCWPLPLAVASGLALLLAVRLRAAARPGGLLESLRT